MSVPLLISGSIAIDRIMSFEGRYSDLIHVQKLDSLSISIFLKEMKDAYGGVGANIAYSLALLGEEPILISAAGKDSVTYLEKLAHNGVNITHIYESPLPTAAFNVITDSDQNQVGGFYPGAMFDSSSLTLAPWKDASPIVIISPQDPKSMLRQIKECKRWGLRMCYDIGQQVTNVSGPDMRVGVEAAEVLIVNDYELTTLSHKSGMSIDKIKNTVPVVITTLGKNGSVIEGNRVSKPVKIGIAKPKRIADPTGAGDAYRAGFLYGYARDWPLKSAAQLGAVCAAYAIETTGTQSHTFTVSEITKRYFENFNEELPSKLSKE